MDGKPDVKSPFIVRNGYLVSLANPQGHIITDAIYENYQVEVQYRFAGKPGNCGVLVHASTPRVLYGMFPKSIEAQLMHDNAGDFWCIGGCFVWNGDLGLRLFDGDYSGGQHTGGEVADAGRAGEF